MDETGRRLGDRFREHLRAVMTKTHPSQWLDTFICDLSLQLGNSESSKSLRTSREHQISTEKNLSVKWALLIHMILTNAFHPTNLFFFFHVTMFLPIAYHLFLYNPHTTHNFSIHSYDGVALETSALETRL